MLHWKVDRASDERNAKRTLLADARGGAFEIVVFGGFRSTRHLHLAAVASNEPSLPART